MTIDISNISSASVSANNSTEGGTKESTHQNLNKIMCRNSDGYAFLTMIKAEITDHHFIGSVMWMRACTLLTNHFKNVTIQFKV